MWSASPPPLFQTSQSLLIYCLTTNSPYYLENNLNIAGDIFPPDIRGQSPWHLAPGLLALPVSYSGLRAIQQGIEGLHSSCDYEEEMVVANGSQYETGRTDQNSSGYRRQKKE